jgi:hypothetical protein
MFIKYVFESAKIVRNYETKSTISVFLKLFQLFAISTPKSVGCRYYLPVGRQVWARAMA